MKSSADGGSSNRFTLILFIAIVLGCLVGLACNALIGPDDVAPYHTAFDLMSRIFLRLIKMIIGPLVLTTLTAGIARMGSGAHVGGTALKALAIFIVGSIIVLGLGAMVVLTLAPGEGLHLVAGATEAVPTAHADLSAATFVDRIVPASVFEALTTNAVLQIVVFALFTGFALASLGARGQALTAIVDDVAHLMLVIANYVMRFAPLGVFGATAAAFTTHGIGLIGTYAAFVGEFYIVLAMIVALLTALSVAVLGRRAPALLLGMREPTVIAFSTGSSEVAYPKLLMVLEEFGVPPAVAGFVLPLGYAFNLVGSMAYCSFATIFIAQAFDVHLSGGDIALMLGMLMVMSKGIANVPRASLVVIAAVLPYFQIPDAGVALVLGVDQLLDMGRTGVNSIANGVAAAVVAKWEKVLENKETA